MNPLVLASVIPFLEMAVFCSTKIHVTGCGNSGNPFHFTSVIIEYAENSIVAEIDATFTKSIICIYPTILEAVVRILIPFTHRVIEISAEIHNVTIVPDNRVHLIFTNLHEVEHKELRSSKRISVSSGEQLLQTFICSCFGQQVRKHQVTLSDISEAAAAVVIENSILPFIKSGKPESFVIKKSGRIVFKVKINMIRPDTNHLNAVDSQRHIVFFRHDSPHGTHIDRRIHRIAPIKDPLVFIEAIHPLMPMIRITGELIDFSKLGFLFSLHDPSISLFPGLVLHHIKILIPYESPIKVSAKVVHCTRCPSSDGDTVHIGVEIIRFSDALNINANIFYQKELDPTLVDAGPEDFEKIISHLFLSNFIYSGKRSLLQEHAQEILATQYRLLQRNTVSKTLISKKNGVVGGFIQYLKYHNHAWLVQHLAGGSKCSPKAGKMVVCATIEFFLNPVVNRSLNIDYVLSYFQPGNSFPMILFNGFTKWIANPLVSQTHDYDYCTAISSADMHAPQADFICSTTTDDELRILEKCIDKQFGVSFKRAEGLGRNELKNTRLSKEYRHWRLMRERRVLCVKTTGGMLLAFSVAEYCSPGASLSELTNSFKIYRVENGGIPCPEEALDALASFTLEEYRKRGIVNPIFLNRSGSYRPKPFILKKKYQFWFLESSHFGDLKTYFEVVTSDLKTYLRRFRNSNNE